ncbi:MAG: rane-flanked domain protein [Thermoleophilia bacterium]|nr:rane-flanked domain protein [Thermoleophilia bacterium]
MRRRRGIERRRGLRRYLGAEEQTLLVTRQHPLALVRAALDAGALVLPLAIAAWGIAGIELLRGPVADWAVRILLVVMLGIVGRLAWHVLAWDVERVMVTDEKVIHVAGVLDLRIASTPLAKVSEFTVRQPLLGRLFDYGSLVVDVPGGRDQALHGLAYLPDPAGLYRLVSGQARRGRITEGGGVDEHEARAPSPTVLDLDGLDRSGSSSAAGLPGIAPGHPWEPTLHADDADHTIAIPRVRRREPGA